MPATRSAARQTRSNANGNSSPASSTSARTTTAAGIKRKTSTGKQRGRPKKQKTIEQTMDLEGEADGKDEEEANEEEDEDAEIHGKGQEEEQRDEKGDVDEEGLDDEEMKDVAGGVGSANAEVEKDVGGTETEASATNGVQDKKKDEEPSAEATSEGEPTETKKEEIQEGGAENGVESETKNEEPPTGNPAKGESTETNNEEPEEAIASDAVQNEEEIEEPHDETAAEVEPTNIKTKEVADAAQAEAKDEEMKTENGVESINGHHAGESNDGPKTDSSANQAQDKTTSTQPTKSSNDNPIEESKERADAQPSNILEKGIIYFLTRGRVGIEEPTGVQDLARSYIILRRLPSGASLGSGALPDSKNNRLLAIPKKVLPNSGRDRFLSFVERVDVTLAELKDSFMQGSTYDTKTTGVRHTPAITPVGQGVYAITSTGRENHLAYMLTKPSESDIDEVQMAMGIHVKGSFVISAKNPQAPSPANASLDKGAQYSGEIMEGFRSLRWTPAEPKHLDYVNAQILLIGEGQGELLKAGTKGGEGEGEGSGARKAPEEEMEKLEEEDMQRVEGLKGDEAVFADLGISKKEFSGIITDW